MAGELEPWMRGTHGELDPVRRAVVHALELAEEDAERWCAPLSQEALFARPFGLPSAGFQLRHMVRSIDRLLTYAEGRFLDERQLELLGTEMVKSAPGEVMREFREGMAAAMERTARVDPARYGEVRGIGRKQLPTTLAGLLIHVAEHTQRHAGQMVTTVKVLRAGAISGADGRNDTVR